jgi:outer membrane receptor for ferrienterochelin and colicins
MVLGLVAADRAAASDTAAAPAPTAAVEEDDELIVVTGSRTAERRRSSVVRTEVLDRDAILRSGAATLADLLEQQPGVQVNRSLRGAQVSLQGMSADHVLVLVDGQRVAGKVDGAVDLTRIATADLAQVEIVRGPASALYGADAMGGVINIITLRPDGRPSAQGSLMVGSGGRRWSDAGLSLPTGPASGGQAQASVQVASGRYGQRFSLNAQQQDAFDLEPADVATNGDGFGQAELSTSARLEVGEGSALQLQASGQRRRAQGVDQSGAGGIYDRRHRTEALSLGLGPDLRLGDRSRLRLTSWTSFFRDQYLLDQRGAAAEDAYQDTRDLWTELRGQLDTQPNNKMLV